MLGSQARKPKGEGGSRTLPEALSPTGDEESQTIRTLNSRGGAGVVELKLAR